MKKLLALSMVVAWAFLAQAEAEVNYWARITDIEQTGSAVAGTLPGKVTMTLVDTGYNDKIIYTKDFDFAKMDVWVDSEYDPINLGTSSFIRPDGRFDIAGFVSQYEVGTVELEDGGGMKYGTLTFDHQTAKVGGKEEDFGICATVEGRLDAVNVYENCAGLTDEEKIAYVEKNLQTIFTVGEEEYEYKLIVQTGDRMNNLKSSAEMKSLSPTPGPVPEPTSGLLLLMGLAGLALKRKQTK